MTTYEQRELAGVSPISEPALPIDPDLGNKKDEAKLHRREAKELRLFNNEMVPYNKNRELTDALWNPYEDIKNQLREWNYRTISEDEALNIPYRKAA